MTTPPIRNDHGDELTNFTEQLAYGISQDPLTLVDTSYAVWVLDQALQPPSTQADDD